MPLFTDLYIVCAPASLSDCIFNASDTPCFLRTGTLRKILSLAFHRTAKGLSE